jgi:hypothetical protein
LEPQPDVKLPTEPENYQPDEPKNFLTAESPKCQPAEPQKFPPAEPQKCLPAEPKKCLPAEPPKCQPTATEPQKCELAESLKGKNRSNWGPKRKRIEVSNDSGIAGNGESEQSPSHFSNVSVEKPMELVQPICPKLTSLAGSRRKSVTERRSSKDVESSTKEVDKISEDEARKRKYQPQVVVEKIDTVTIK